MKTAKFIVRENFSLYGSSNRSIYVNHQVFGKRQNANNIHRASLPP